MASAPEVASRHGAGRRGIQRSARWSGGRCRRSFGKQTSSQRSGGHSAGGFEKIAAGSSGVSLIVFLLIVSLLINPMLAHVCLLMALSYLRSIPVAIGA